MVRVEGLDFSVPREQQMTFNDRSWRVQNLRSGLHHYGVLPMTGEPNSEEDYHPEKLNEMPLNELRLIYGLSNPYHSDELIGSIGLSPRTAPRDKVFVDISDPSYQQRVKKGDPMWQVDFVPFGIDEKVAGLGVAGIYLGCLDLTRTIQQRIGEKSKPRVLLISTNATTANFIANRWNFHMWGATLIDETGTAQEIPEEDIETLMRNIIAGRDETPRGQSLLFNLYAKTSDIFNPDFFDTLLAMKATVLKRGMASTKATTEEEYERELRILGISLSLHHLNLQLIENSFYAFAEADAADIPRVSTTPRERHNLYHQQRVEGSNKSNKNKKKMQKKSQQVNRKK